MSRSELKTVELALCRVSNGSGKNEIRANTCAYMSDEIQKLCNFSDSTYKLKIRVKIHANVLIF